MEGKWTEIKGDIIRAWGKVTGDELDQVKGDAVKVAGLIQQKYGIAKEEAVQKLNDLVDRHSDNSSEKRSETQTDKQPEKQADKH